MPTPNTQPATGTPAGNPCAFYDFIRPGEESSYRDLHDSLIHDLAPSGILEYNLVDEIRRAMWRLRRCGLVEESMAQSALTIGDDPMQNEAQARIQLTVDRSRSQAHRILHKCTAELRKLQTERIYRNESLPAGTDISSFGICDSAFIQKTLDQAIIAGHRRQTLADKAMFEAILNAPLPSHADSGSFCKNAEAAVGAPFAIPKAA